MLIEELGQLTRIYRKLLEVSMFYNGQISQPARMNACN